MVYANEWSPIPGQLTSPEDVPYGLDLPGNVTDAIKLLVSEGFLDDGCAVFDYLECIHDQIDTLKQELRNISDAKRGNFEDAEEFRQWVQNRARNALGE